MSGCYEYIDLVQTGADFTSIRQSLQAAVRSMGFSGVAYHVVRPPAGQIPQKNWNTYSKDWVDHYFTKGYPDIDPTFSAAATTIMPFRWKAFRFDQHTSNRQRRLFDEAREFGIYDGVTIPLHGPTGGLATLSLSIGTKGGEVSETWSLWRDELTLMGAYTHEAMLRSAESKADYVSIKLTDRERECLTWTAKGKTTWEVARILSIAGETVRFHLKNAMSKLDVYSKHHAVVKAIMQGLIVP